MHSRYARFNRYGDLSKFITNPDLLQAASDETVWISSKADYDIAVDLEGCPTPFEEMKPFIALLATKICELDNTVQRFYQKKKMKESGYLCIPSSKGILRFDYLRSMENRPASQRKGFPDYLAYIYIEEPSVLLFDYWCTGESVQLEVVFEYKAEEFCLRRFGVVGGIPDHWEDA